MIENLVCQDLNRLFLQGIAVKKDLEVSSLENVSLWEQKLYQIEVKLNEGIKKIEQRIEEIKIVEDFVNSYKNDPRILKGIEKKVTAVPRTDRFISEIEQKFFSEIDSLKLDSALLQRFLIKNSKVNFPNVFRSGTHIKLAEILKAVFLKKFLKQGETLEIDLNLPEARYLHNFCRYLEEGTIVIKKMKFYRHSVEGGKGESFFDLSASSGLGKNIDRVAKVVVDRGGDEVGASGKGGTIIANKVEDSLGFGNSNATLFSREAGYTGASNLDSKEVQR